jgi:hypothetical protein
VEKSSSIIWTISVVKILPKVNSYSMGQNSPNLATLDVRGFEDFGGTTLMKKEHLKCFIQVVNFMPRVCIILLRKFGLCV